MPSKFGFETKDDRNIMVEKATKKVAREASRIRPIIIEILDDYLTVVKSYHASWPARAVFASKIEESMTELVGRDGAYSVTWTLGEKIQTGNQDEENEDGVFVELYCDSTFTYIGLAVRCGGCFRHHGKIREIIYQHTGLKERNNID